MTVPTLVQQAATAIENTANVHNEKFHIYGWQKSVFCLSPSVSSLLLQIMKLEIEEISALRSFVFLWCGSGEGLDLGRMVIGLLIQPDAHYIYCSFHAQSVRIM